MIKDAGTIYFVFKLMDRGLTAENIDRAMKKMVGQDWRELHASAWLQRLGENGFIERNECRLSVDVLEALVKGSTRIDNMT